MLWTPVEKLFLNEIGFDAAAVGVMAAAYAALVPLVEVPSGLLADRWSRRGVLIIANLALLLSVLVGGLSHERGDLHRRRSAARGLLRDVQRHDGRDRLRHGAHRDREQRPVRADDRPGAGGGERRPGGQLAGRRPAGRAAVDPGHLLPLPAVHACCRSSPCCASREPTLHQTTERAPLRAQIAVTFRTVAGRGRLLPVVALAVLTALISQVVFEFGPLWLVALAAAPCGLRTVLGRARRHPRPRRAAGRPAADGPTGWCRPGWRSSWPWPRPC